MTYNEKKSLYESIMSEVSKFVNKKLNEEFKAPEKTTAEKLFGMDKKYAARVAAAEAEYYKEYAERYSSILLAMNSFNSSLLGIFFSLIEYSLLL